MNRRKAFKASMVRLVFLCHGMIAVFSAVYTTQLSEYWFIGVTSVLSMFEMILTYRLNENGEWKWFVPSAFIYLMAVTPVVWILELSMLDFRLTLQAEIGDKSNCFYKPQDFCVAGGNLTTVTRSKKAEETYELQSSFSTTLQQTLMLVLILGRWLLPKGQLTRDQLSQLLLVYIGMAADMLEFSSETLRLEKIACNLDIFYLILAVWTWSLMQFTLGLTATKARKRRVAAKVYRSELEELNKRRYRYSKKVSVFCCGTELWALLTSVVIQDGPYLCVRLYLIFALGIYDQSTIFFTCKNALLLILQFYRLSVVLTETYKQHEKSLRIRRHAQLTTDEPIKPEDPTNEDLTAVNEVALAVISGHMVPNGGSATNHTDGGNQVANHTTHVDDVGQHRPNGDAVVIDMGNGHVETESPKNGSSNRRMNGGLKVDDAEIYSHHSVTFNLDDDR
ncbi:transmembrane protein 26-like [Asterias rubens]|uniref:transmembrane protein 26-like n=1 Tax=Asterias rubens TaxID=7604 RepID=UPI00145561B6|nr:transmembrane protein 26-like [Asterias rubens]